MIFLSILGSGLDFRSLITNRSEIVGFDAYAVDVVKVLGPIRSIFYKENGDYIYNYFSYGLDFVFDMETYLLSKIIMHTNNIHSIFFGEYERCNFSLRWGDLIITPNTQWLEAREHLGEEVEYYKRRYPSGFKTTTYYCYPNMLLEICEDGSIATITLIKT